MKKKFNNQMLKVARSFRGFSQTNLAEKTEMTQGNYSKIEMGLLVPEKDIVTKFSKALNFPINWFYINDEYFMLPLTPFHKR